MPERTLTRAVAAALVALMVAACGSSGHSGASANAASRPANGVASRSADQIVAAATSAIDGVSSVRVSGSVRQSASHSIALDLRIANGKGATGTVSENGLKLQIVSTGATAYVKGSSTFLRQFGGAAAVKMFAGHWMKAPASTGAFASLASLTDLHTLVRGLLSSHGALTRGATSTVDGVPVVAVVDRSKGGTLYVATHGKPYPVEIANARTAGGGEISFGDFDAPVTVTAPSGAIDLSTLK